MSRGFSLLELLVAVLVVAVGALGVAGLQLASSQNNRGAMAHSLATLLAGDLAERMRANPAAGYGIAIGEAPPSFVDCHANACSSVELARFDLAVWKCSLGAWRDEATCRAMPDTIRPATVLAGGDGSVDESGGIATVTVVWRGTREAFAAEVRR